VLDFLPKPIFVLAVVVYESCAGATSEWMKRFAGCPCFNTLITAIDLGPGFFEDQDPDLVAVF